MANELTLTGSISFAKSPVLAVGMLKSGAQFTVAGTNYSRQTMVAVTADFTAVDVGAITTAGYIFIQNNDATNYVTVAPDASGSAATVKINPGEFAVFRCASSTLAVKAHTANCVVEFLLIEA